MKKSLLAIAAVGAFASAAQAQSSVTVYGLLDMGISSLKTKTTGNVETTTSGTGLRQSLANSRLGFRGTEDLGGGLTAGFTIEGNLHANPGTTGSNSATAFQFGRHQFVTLTSKTAGGVLIGKTDSLVKQIFDAYDAGFANNMTGAYDGMGTSLTEITGDNVIGSRRDSVVRYTTPSFSGATATVGIMKSTVDATTNGLTTTDTEDESGYELGARYAAGALSIGIAHRNAKSQNVAVAAGTANTTGVGSLGAAAVTAADGTVLSTIAGASYNFGPATAFAQYIDQANKNNLTGLKTTENAVAVGVRVPVTNVATLFSSYTTGDKTSTTNVKTKFSGYQAGALYALSKRTDLYALYGSSKLKADTSTTDATASGMAFGVRHTF